MRIALLAILLSTSFLAIIVLAANLGEQVTIKEGESASIGDYKVTVDSVAASGTAKARFTVSRAGESTTTDIIGNKSIDVTVGLYTINVKATSIVLGRAATVILSNERQVTPSTSEQNISQTTESTQPVKKPSVTITPTITPIGTIEPTPKKVEPVIEPKTVPEKISPIKIKPTEGPLKEIEKTTYLPEPITIEQLLNTITDFFRNLAGGSAAPRSTGTGTDSTDIGQGKSAPTISVSVDNANPPVDKVLTIGADASDNTKVSTIKIYVDDKLANTCNVNAKSGSCYYRPVYNSAGKHTYYATAVDDEGITSRDPVSGTKTINVGVDTTKPTVSVSVDPATPVEGQKSKIIATASDNQKLSKIEIFIDDQLFKTCDIKNYLSGNVESCTFESVEGIGKRTYYAKATDASGLTSTTPKQSYNVVADKTPPTFSTSISPANPKVGEIMKLTVIATDDYNTVTGIDVYTDGTKQISCDGFSGFQSVSCSVEIFYFSEGQHTFYATAVDSSLNANKGTSDTKSFTLTPSTDKNSPVLDVNIDVNSPTVAQTFKINTNISMESGGKIYIPEGSSAAFSGSYTVTVSSVSSSGTANSTIKVCDSNNNCNSTWFTEYETKNLKVGMNNVDVLVYEIILGRGVFITLININTTQNYGITSSATIYIDGEAKKTCGPEHIGVYIKDSNGLKIGKRYLITGVSNCLLETSYETTGSHTYYATATDSSNNVGTSETKSFNIIADKTKPTIQVYVNPSKPKTGETVTLFASALDDAKVSVIHFYIDGQRMATCPNIPAAASGSCTHDTGFYTEGSHTLYAEAVDFSGNIGKSEIKTFTVCCDPLSVSASHSPLKPKVNEQVTFTVKATDDEGVESGSVFLYVDNEYAQSLTADKNGNYIATRKYGSEGKHTYYATAMDIRGNFRRYPASGTLSFNVGVAPTVTITHSPANPKVGQEVTFTATGNDDVQVKQMNIFVDDEKFAKTYCIGTPSKTLTCNYKTTYPSSGTHKYYAIVTDTGNLEGRDPATGLKSLTVS